MVYNFLMISDDAPPDLTDDATELPGVSTWRGVYLAVGVIFVVWVVLLAALPWLFS